MAGDRIPSLIMQIVDELRVQGILITSRAGEWCVNFRGGGEATAYITDDLQDAFDHGRAMAMSAATEAATPNKPALDAGRKWRRPISAKAMRRRFINRRRPVTGPYYPKGRNVGVLPSAVP